jgi:hypothetical protein
MAARVSQDLATSTSQKNLHGPLPPLRYVPDSDSNRVQFGGEGDEGKKRRTQCPIPKNAANALLNTCGWRPPASPQEREVYLKLAKIWLRLANDLGLANDPENSQRLAEERNDLECKKAS